MKGKRMTTEQNQTLSPPPRSLAQWCRDAGINRVTAWQWRKRGWLETVSICGTQYVTADASARFTQRAQAGEFAGTRDTTKATAARKRKAAA